MKNTALGFVASVLASQVALADSKAIVSCTTASEPGYQFILSEETNTQFDEQLGRDVTLTQYALKRAWNGRPFQSFVGFGTFTKTAALTTLYFSAGEGYVHASIDNAAHTAVIEIKKAIEVDFSAKTYKCE